jgi:hypothetical protein
MKTSRKMKAWMAAAVCLFVSFPVSAGDIVATGGWNETVDSSDLTSGAGSDLASTYQSIASATDLDVTAAADYRVDVRRTDGTWSGDFTLSVRRTAIGGGSGTVSGGTTYQSVTTTDAEFFTGNGNRSGIKLQYQLEGMSVSISPDTYTTTVTYTIVDL